MRPACARVRSYKAILRRALLVIPVAGVPRSLAGTVDLSLLVALVLVGSVGVHFLTGNSLIPEIYLQAVRHAGTALAGLWICLALFQVWAGWGVRKLYAGPVFGDTPAEPLGTVCLYRVGIAAGWTVGIVAALLVLSVLGRAGVGAPELFIPESRAWLTDYGWWVAWVTFAWSAPWQLEYIWDDLNKAAEE
jgi:hypothetical protein